MALSWTKSLRHNLTEFEEMDGVKVVNRLSVNGKKIETKIYGKDIFRGDS